MFRISKKKRAASEFLVYVLCWLPLFHIHQSYMLGCKKKKKKKNLSGLVSAWETTWYLHEDVATREKERRASLRPAPRAPVCPGG